MLIFLALCSGLALIAIGLWARRLGVRCTTWPSTNGSIIESLIDDSDLETIRPRIRYRYTVGDRQLVGWRVSYSGYGTSRRAMRAYIAEYPQDGVVKVYYDPENPERSVLSNTRSSDWFLWSAAGVGFCLGSIVLALR